MAGKRHCKRGLMQEIEWTNSFSDCTLGRTKESVSAASTEIYMLDPRVDRHWDLRL